MRGLLRISEESAILRFPAVTIRDFVERPEALDAGTIMMSGLKAAGVLEALTVVTQTRTGGGPTVPEEYSIVDDSRRTVNYILSTAKRHAFWAGLHDR